MSENNLLDKQYEGKWTLFWDMHSGGSTKYKDFDKIYVQGSEQEARGLFELITGEYPDDVACPCCGENYSVDEYEDLHQASAYHRGCRHDASTKKYVEEQEYSWKMYVGIDDYIKEDNVLLIFADKSTNHKI